MRKRKITDKEKEMMNGVITVEETKEPVVLVGDKYMLTIREASIYFSIGEKKLRRLAEACFKAFLRCLHTIRKCVTIWQGDYA